MLKWVVFGGSEARLALYSSLISHFRPFRKNRKNRRQKGCQMSCFLMKNDALAVQGLIYSAILIVFRGLENHVFFDADLAAQKVEKTSGARTTCFV